MTPPSPESTRQRSGASTLESARFDLAPLDARLRAASDGYRLAAPFPHVVLDEFLPSDIADRLASDFPAIVPEMWINYLHVNERKYGLNDWAAMPASIVAVMQVLNSPGFVRSLTALTRIPDLLADRTLEGGGLHQSARGGHLNVHADFTGHPHRTSWHRRINLLLYLNPGWRDDWGGHLELWSRDMGRCVQRIAPRHNRAVIFTTDRDSFHGHPEPLACPQTVTRKSIALYYFTAEEAPFPIRSTEYRARPGDGVKSALIYLDTLALRTYDRAKRLLGLNDQFTSRLLRTVARLRGR